MRFGKYSVITFLSIAALKVSAKDLPNPSTTLIECLTYDDEAGSSRPGKMSVRLVERIENSQTYKAVFELSHRFPDQGYQTRSSSFTTYTTLDVLQETKLGFLITASHRYGQLADLTIDLGAKTGTVGVRHELENVRFATLELKACKTTGAWD